MTTAEQVEAFLANERFAVAGASRDRAKYGNKCLRAYLQADRDVVAIHPSHEEIEGVPAYPRLRDVPAAPGGRPQAVSIVTPPTVTEALVEEAGALGVAHLWMQPGAESAAAVARARELGMNVIAGGPCLLVVLRFRE